MSTRLARTADGWWLDSQAGLVRLAIAAPGTGELLADKDTLAAPSRPPAPRAPRIRSWRCRPSRWTC
jgi:hypothetical protein